jgi:hypothetical protein
MWVKLRSGSPSGATRSSNVAQDLDLQDFTLVRAAEERAGWRQAVALRHARLGRGGKRPGRAQSQVGIVGQLRSPLEERFARRRAMTIRDTKLQ